MLSALKGPGEGWAGSWGRTFLRSREAGPDGGAGAGGRAQPQGSRPDLESAPRARGWGCTASRLPSRGAPAQFEAFLFCMVIPSCHYQTFLEKFVSGPSHVWGNRGGIQGGLHRGGESEAGF